jgi:DNA adenine methylase
MGSKNRHAKELLQSILHNRKPNQWYVEPFVGGFNMIDKVGGNRIANDINFYLIELFKAIQDGWQPPDFISEKTISRHKAEQRKLPQSSCGIRRVWM